MRFRAGL